jgi:hypothetical protein
LTTPTPNSGSPTLLHLCPNTNSSMALFLKISARKETKRKGLRLELKLIEYITDKLELNSELTR